MSKYINADTVIQALREIIDKYKDSESFTRTVRAAENMITIIKRMPSADVRENIHGEWIYIGDGMDFYAYECSVCHKDCDAQENSKYNFCPNCGADMRERKETK